MEIPRVGLQNLNLISLRLLKIMTVRTLSNARRCNNYRTYWYEYNESKGDCNHGVKNMATIKNISAIEVLSGSGRPTVEVELETSEGIQATASVPCGTSTGKYESKTLYDGGKRYRGFGVQKAVSNVNDVIAPKLIGMDVTAQSDIDNLMIDLDGTPTKENLGGDSFWQSHLLLQKLEPIPAVCHFTVTSEV